MNQFVIILLLVFTAKSVDAFTACTFRHVSRRSNNNQHGCMSDANDDDRYLYFAYGSNMVRSTMTALRNLRPLNATAAILPDYQLRFTLGGIPGIEPSAAVVQEVQYSTRNNKSNSGQQQQQLVHGVLYTLTSRDFARVGQTEGVPWGYRWKAVRAIPYTGNTNDSGQLALEKVLKQRQTTRPSTSVHEPAQNSNLIPCYTLVAPPSLDNAKDIPPSKSYRDILVRGAREWLMDRDYVEYLEGIPHDETSIGVSGLALNLAELFNNNGK